MHIRCTCHTEKLTESHFEGQASVAFTRMQQAAFHAGYEEVVDRQRTWEFVFRHPTDATESELVISFVDIEIIKITGLSVTGHDWNGLPNREILGPHARAVLDLCLPGILGTVTEILTMDDDGTTVAFAIARFVGMPARIETKLQLDYEIEDEHRVQQLLAPFA